MALLVYREKKEGLESGGPYVLTLTLPFPKTPSQPRCVPLRVSEGSTPFRPYRSVRLVPTSQALTMWAAGDSLPERPKTVVEEDERSPWAMSPSQARECDPQEVEGILNLQSFMFCLRSRPCHCWTKETVAQRKKYQQLMDRGIMTSTKPRSARIVRRPWELGVTLTDAINTQQYVSTSTHFDKDGE